MRSPGVLVGLIVLSVISRASPCDALSSECAPALGTASSAPTAGSPALSIHHRNGLVSLEAKERPWEELLQEFSRQSGIIFHVRLPLEGTVTASFTGLPLEQALHRLFGRGANLMLVYRSGRPTVSSPGLPSEVWIFSSSRRAISESSGPRDAEPEADPPALEDAENPAQALAREFEDNPGAALESAQWHPDPRVQRVAITYLGEQATAEALDTLYSLLEDGESWVRQSALEALGPLVQHHRLVRENLVRILERSEDSDTRHLLADSLGVSPETVEPGQPIAPDVVDDATD
jgi:HEAT repeats